MYPGTHAASAPHRPAVVLAGSGKALTYRELDDNSARLASALHALGPPVRCG
jgi:fatty-acyl-CoA synthase